MTTREIMDAAMEATGLTQVAAAKKMNWTAQQLGQRFIRESFKTDEFLKLMDVMGIDVKFIVRETGEELKKKVKGHGRRVRAMSDGVTYDTEMSEVLANSFYEDGINEYGIDGHAQELYIDKNGRYFLAEYSNVEGEKDRVRSIPGNIAAAFIEKYGTEIEKGPKNE